VIVSVVVATLTVVAVLALSAASAPTVAAPAPAPTTRARLPRTSPLLMSAVAGPAGAFLGYSIAGLSGLVIVGIGSAVVPLGVVRRRRAKRLAMLEEQMLDLVSSLASGVRAGRSLEQALSLAATELEAPLAPTVEAIVDLVALGEPLDDALERWGRDLGTPDARLVVGVLRLQRRSGGGLSRPLEDLAETLRARRAGARELRSLTAQARLSAGILGLLPVGFFLFLSVVSRRDIEDAIRTPAGLGAIGVGVALQGAAFVWIRSLLRVEA
jgi:tight adherence protein B